MPKIDFEPKLDFDQVLIRPKRSELNSRNEVDLTRTFHFKHGAIWNGVPVIAANMSTTGTFEIYQQLSQHKMLTALHKFYKPEHFKKFIDTYGEMNPDYFMISTGISHADFENLSIKVVDCHSENPSEWFFINPRDSITKYLGD